MSLHNDVKKNKKNMDIFFFVETNRQENRFTELNRSCAKHTHPYIIQSFKADKLHKRQ